jgi:hypothetical protein
VTVPGVRECVEQVCHTCVGGERVQVAW